MFKTSHIAKYLSNLPLSANMGHGGSVLGVVHCVRKVAGSNPTLATTKGPWASPSLVADSEHSCEAF